MKITGYMLAIIFLLFSCSNSDDPDYDADYNLIRSLEIRQAIALANEWKYTNPDITSYVNPDKLVVKFPDGRQVNISLPEDEMYIAVAPYINNTHSCSTHYISSCRGEMTQKIFTLFVQEKNGPVLIDNKIETKKNGFFELWLPRDKQLEVKIYYQNKVSEFELLTTRLSKTCITTAKLE